MASSGYTAWSVIAGETPTTTKWNLLGSNDASFNTGVGINDGAIVTRVMKPTYVYYDGTTLNNGTTSRSTVASGASNVPTGCSVIYRTGTTNEVLRIDVSALMSSATAGSVCGIAVAINGAMASHRTYWNNSAAGQWNTQYMSHVFNATANTNYSIGIWVIADNAVTTICNATGDHASGYDPHLSIMSWSR